MSFIGRIGSLKYTAGLLQARLEFNDAAHAELIIMCGSPMYRQQSQLDQVCSALDIVLIWKARYIKREPLEGEQYGIFALLLDDSSSFFNLSRARLDTTFQDVIDANLSLDASVYIPFPSIAPTTSSGEPARIEAADGDNPASIENADGDNPARAQDPVEVARTNSPVGSQIATADVPARVIKLHGTNFISSDGFVAPLAFFKKHPSTDKGIAMMFACRCTGIIETYRANFVTFLVQVSANLIIRIKVRKELDLHREVLSLLPIKREGLIQDPVPSQTEERLYLLRGVTRCYLGFGGSCLRYDNGSTFEVTPTTDGCSIDRIFEFNNAMNADFIASNPDYAFL